MVLPRQEYWNELSFPSPGDVPNPISSPELAGGFLTTEPSIRYQSQSKADILYREFTKEISKELVLWVFFLPHNQIMGIKKGIKYREEIGFCKKDNSLERAVALLLSLS